MPLTPGRQLLHYRLVEKIGEGGMGEVWKALDTTLDRAVAIKILPQTVAADAVKLGRFEREAKLLASLNHPNIATIHGLHSAPGAEHAGEIRFLAMELIDGEDLSRVLERGPLPVDEAVRIATRVAEALETAHDNGIVHRDLKPANVALTAEGAVKVLDFGLAKALEPETTDAGSPELSPTMTSAATAVGMIMGTAGYMSPQQARGEEVDARADVWALGCLIYEMLTATRAYEGKTISDTLASVLRADPEWEALPAEAPPGLIRVMKRCLVKDARDRVRHAGDVRLDLADLSKEEDRPAADDSASRGRPALLAAVAAVAVVALALAAWGWLRPKAAAAVQQTVSFEVRGGTEETPIDPWSIAVSPDGRRFAWVVRNGARTSIHVREIGAVESRELPHTEGAGRLTFSPDGQSIAFFSGTKLRRIDLGARAAIDLCAAVYGAGLSWGGDGSIVFNSGWIAALSRVSAEGGAPEPATRLDPQDGEIGHWFPHILPDNEHVLVSRWRKQLNDMSVGIASLATGETRELIPRASFARYAAGTGRLLFTRAGAVYAVPFDAERLEVTGEAVQVLDNVEQDWGSGNSTWAVSSSGVLAYLPGGMWTTKRRIVRVARDGTIEPLDVEPASYRGVAITPDGKSLALTEFKSGETNLRIRNLERGTDTRLPPGTVNTWALWGASDRELVFTTARNGPWDVYRVSLDRISEPEALVQGTPDQVPLDWSRDGRYLFYQQGYDELHALDFESGSEVTSFTRTPAARAAEQGLDLSPDSRWLAFMADTSGQDEIFIQRFPDGARAWQVSIGGGITPQWSADGSELFYRRGKAVFAASIRVSGDEVVPGRPRELFRGNFVNQEDLWDWSYDPSTDSFVMILEGDDEISSDRFLVLMGWGGELGVGNQ